MSQTIFLATDFKLNWEILKYLFCHPPKSAVFFSVTVTCSLKADYFPLLLQIKLLL